MGTNGQKGEQGMPGKAGSSGQTGPRGSPVSNHDNSIVEISNFAWSFFSYIPHNCF